MNIQIYIDQQLTDIDDNTSITLQKEFESEEENIVKEIEYSYEISFPTTIKNKSVFGFIDSFDVPNKFSRLYDAQLYVNDVLILDGKLKLSEIDKEYFKGNIYNPANATVSDILGDRMLNEIQPHMKPMNTCADYNQQNNYVMNSNSTDIPKAQYRDRHVCYPYILWSLPYNDPDVAYNNNYDFYTQDLKYEQCNLSFERIFPAYNVLSVLKDVFATEGYNLIGNVFEDDKFVDLYQTFQYSYTDFSNERYTPYYLNFKCNYDSYNQSMDNISSTLQSAIIWNEDDRDGGRQHYWTGNFEYGVDNPLVSENSTITEVSNKYKMLSKGKNSNAYAVFVPKSGWYKIKTKGTMTYPSKGTSFFKEKNGRENVGSVQGQNTDDIGDLRYMPFEFQIKTGYPADNPKLYSAYNTLPVKAINFNENYTIKYDGQGTYMKCFPNERQRFFPKNRATCPIKEYSDFSVKDFICGARLGGAISNADANHGASKGCYPRPNKLSYRFSLFSLPRTDVRPRKVELDDDEYYQLSQGISGNSTYTYASSTSTALVREDTYFNFEGYNMVNQTYTAWDTTSNFDKKTYAGADNNSTYTNNYYSGGWDVNTVVWLEKDDTINVELLMPQIRKANYRGGSLFKSSKYSSPVDFIVRTQVNFDFEMAYINSDREWVPSTSDPIPTFDKLKADVENNVNQWLPNIKCNDYLSNFLQTFNLQLTRPFKNTFSIDSITNKNIDGNIISLEKYVNNSEATYKVLDTPTTRELAFKFDKTETGYADGNQSPYKTENLPWYNSGYTGSISITNETNPSNSIDKKESQWSYNWYKTINFINGSDGLSVKKCDVPVISEARTWSRESSYDSASKEALQTAKTFRLFTLARDENTTLYKYVAFPYDQEKIKTGSTLLGAKYTYKDVLCKLVIPSNYIKTKNYDEERYYYLDYSDVLNQSKNTRTITDIFFNLKVLTGYQVDVPVTLPNDLYSQIKAGTLFKLNDGLYKIAKIEGHDVSEYDNATLSMLTLN